MNICLLSDTHSYLDPAVLHWAEKCDEIWHAGDIGSLELAHRLAEVKPLRAVFGNIDDREIRLEYPEDQLFECEGASVFMTHIGGYPGRYAKGIRARLTKLRPSLFICGHSHILRIQKDEKLGVFHLNPGACGRVGFHQVRTLMILTLEERTLTDLKVVELGPRTG